MRILRQIKEMIKHSVGDKYSLRDVNNYA